MWRTDGRTNERTGWGTELLAAANNNQKNQQYLKSVLILHNFCADLYLFLQKSSLCLLKSFNQLQARLCESKKVCWLAKAESTVIRAPIYQSRHFAKKWMIAGGKNTQPGNTMEILLSCPSKPKLYQRLSISLEIGESYKNKLQVEGAHCTHAFSVFKLKALKKKIPW